MAVYFAMFFFSELFAILALNTSFHNNRKRKGLLVIPCEIDIKKVFFILSAIPFLAVAVFRYNIGTDYIVYKRLQIPEVMNGINDRVEFLYRIIIKMGMALGDPQWVFAITHVLIILFIWLYMRQSDNLCMSIFIFLFSGAFNISLNIMRQYIAIAICAYAIQYIHKKKPLNYYILVTIATLFHVTAVIFLLFYPLSKIKIHGFMPVIISILSFGVSAIARNVLNILVRYLDSYAHYMENEKYDKNDTQYDFVLFEIMILFGGCLVQYFYEKRKNNTICVKYSKQLKALAVNIEKEDLKMRIYTWIQLFTCIFACLSGIIPNSTRIIIFPAIGQLVYVPMVLKRSKKLNTYMYYALLGMYISIYLLMFWRLIIFKDLGETKVYHSIFLI